MKRLFILAIFVIAVVIGANAQSYTVEVNWDASTATWGLIEQPGDGFAVWITVYDVANDVSVITNHPSGWVYKDVEQYTYTDLNSYVIAHCNDGGLQYEPDYDVYVSVKVINKDIPVLYDQQKTTINVGSCSNFSSGVSTPLLTF